MGLAWRAQGPKVEGGGGRPGLSCPRWELGWAGEGLRSTQHMNRTSEAGVCWPRGAALLEKGLLDGPRLCASSPVLLWGFCLAPMPHFTITPFPAGHICQAAFPTSGLRGEPATPGLCLPGSHKQRQR